MKKIAKGCGELIKVLKIIILLNKQNKNKNKYSNNGIYNKIKSQS